MRTIGVNIYYFLLSICDTLRYIYYRNKEKRQYGAFEFPYHEELLNNRVYVLANGPSLKQELEELIEEESFSSSIKCVANFFANSEEFTTLKPNFYFLADPKFFKGDLFEKENLLVRHLDEIVSWPMTLFITKWAEGKTRNLIKNPNITIRAITDLQFHGFEKFRFKFYKQGKASPLYVNVLIMMEYALLNMGCKDIRLYGVDHTFFDGLMVDEENHIGHYDKHYYGENFKIERDHEGQYYTTAGWLYDKYLTFKEHEIVRGYADYLGAQIINCTKCSLIDAYVRLSQIEK